MLPSAEREYRKLAGYKCRCRNRVSGGDVVVYNADDAHMDPDGGKYAVVCNVHSSILNVQTLAAARSAMKVPTDFCEGCREYEKNRKPRKLKEPEKDQPLRATGMHFEKCQGEAHSNPYIDHCMDCAPLWNRIPFCSCGSQMRITAKFYICNKCGNRVRRD